MKKYIINNKTYTVKRVSIDNSTLTILDRLIYLLMDINKSSLVKGDKNDSTVSKQ